MTAAHLQVTVTCKVVTQNYKTEPITESLEKGSVSRGNVHRIYLTARRAFQVSDRTGTWTVDLGWLAVPASLGAPIPPPRAAWAAMGGGAAWNKAPLVCIARRLTPEPEA